MKKTSLLFLMLALVTTSIHAQESAFEVLLPYQPCYQSFSAESVDGHYLVTPWNNKILKLSKQGDVVNVLEYSIGRATTKFCALLDIPGDLDHHIAVAESFQNDSSGITSNYLHVFKFDDELRYDPDSVVTVDLSGEVRNYAARFNASFVIDEDGCLCFASNAEKLNDSLCLLFVRVSPDGGKTVRFDNQFTDIVLLQVCGLDPHDGHYRMVLGYEIPIPIGGRPSRSVPHLTYYEVDHGFDPVATHPLVTGQAATNFLQYDNQNDSLFTADWQGHHNCAPLWINDSVFLLPTAIYGCSHCSSANGYGAGIWKLDDNLNLIDRVFIDVYTKPTNNDTYKEPFARKPLIINNDNLFYCYATNTGFVSRPRRTVVCKFDINLNLIWKRWYGGEQEYHEVWDFIPTNDGGCLLSGSGGPTPSYIYNPCLYVLKITPDGYCSTGDETLPALLPFSFFPNPVGDVLHMEYSPDVTPARVELLDLQGRLVRSQTTRLESVSTEGLAAGTYTLRVTLEGGKAFTDKVVKQ
jgi:hypothetical protein